MPDYTDVEKNRDSQHYTFTIITCILQDVLITV